MSTLAMVRHGQASFFAENYDQLSPLGEQQARLLGRYWVERGVRFDEVYTGPRMRQIETARLTGEAFATAGLPWPEPVMMPEFDEHHADKLAKVAIAEVTKRYPHIEPLYAAYRDAQTPRDKFRAFQFMFEEIVGIWLEGQVEVPEVETWQQFKQRVARGLAQITEQEQRGRSVAVFTSVGAIIMSLQMALGCSDRTAIEVGWRVRNCTITDFVFTRERIMMDSFNTLPHLTDASLLTYR
jgi:broad specificity phosphatase PhoE